MSFLEIASRTLSQEPLVSTPLVVVSVPQVAAIPLGMCRAPNCPRKALADEVFCFDCLIRSSRHCLNFQTCGKFRFGENPHCKKCQRDFDRRCRNFDRCGNLTAFDHANGRLYPVCSTCFTEQMEFEKLCPNHDTCGGYRRFNHATGYRYDYCPDCAYN